VIAAQSEKLSYNTYSTLKVLIIRKRLELLRSNRERALLFLK
jgi:hypothetical protein